MQRFIQKIIVRMIYKNQNIARNVCAKFLELNENKRRDSNSMFG